MPDVTIGNPRRHELLVINDSEEAPSLLNPLSGQVFVTNTIGKRIIELADGAHTIDGIVDDIVRTFYGASTEIVREEAEVFLRDATEKGLIAWAAAGDAPAL